MYVRYGIPIGHCVSVQRAVVATGSPVTRGLLGNHVERRGPGAEGGADDPELEHVLKFPFGHLEAVRGEASGSCRDGRASGFYVVSDIVLNRSVGGSYLCEGREL